MTPPDWIKSSGGRMTGTRARQLLAEVLSEELGYSITPEQVRRLIERRWSRLSPLAHACHDNYEPEASALTHPNHQGARP